MVVSSLSSLSLAVAQMINSCRHVCRLQRPIVWSLGHFEQAKSDVTRTATDRKLYEELQKCLSSKQFVMNLGLTYDALQLALLSECLAYRNTPPLSRMQTN